MNSDFGYSISNHTFMVFDIGIISINKIINYLKHNNIKLISSIIYEEDKN